MTHSVSYTRNQAMRMKKAGKHSVWSVVALTTSIYWLIYMESPVRGGSSLMFFWASDLLHGRSKPGSWVTPWIILLKTLEHAFRHTRRHALQCVLWSRKILPMSWRVGLVVKVTVMQAKGLEFKSQDPLEMLHGYAGESRVTGYVQLAG